jgi:phosphomannomutase/phosphoglucomutase
MNSFPFHIFRKYDIRGAYGREMTDEVTFRIGRAFVTMCRQRTETQSPLIAVGMDARVHSPALRDAFGSGVVHAGGRWLDIGLCPTPLVYFSAFEMDVDGFAMVTASHNPPEDNGLKLGIGEETIHSEDITLLGQAAAEDPTPDPSSVSGPEDRVDILAMYEDKMVSEFSPLAGEIANFGRPVKIVVDSGNGTAGILFPRILGKLGVQVYELFSEPDGTFPNHHPDPTLPEALEYLRSEIGKHKADAGFSFDGDADRIGVLDQQGEVIWGDMLLLILGLSVIEEWKRGGEKGEPPLIISEVKASNLLYDGIRKAGGRALMWKTGHSLIKAKMKQTGAVLAGEMSGHLFFADRYYGYDDALYGALRLLEIYVASLRKGQCEVFSELLEGLPEVVSTPEIRFPCEEDLKFRAIELFTESLRSHIQTGAEPEIEQIIDIDGVRAQFAIGWGLVRASNTQPVLVLRFEGPDEGTVALYRGLFERLLEKAIKG